MPIPSQDDLLDYIKAIKEPVSKRDLVKAFGVKGDERRPFKALLSQLEKAGLVIRQPGQMYNIPEGLPAVTIIEVVALTKEGDVLAEPVEGAQSVGKPRIEVLHDSKKGAALGIGDRALARLTRDGNDGYRARVIKRIEKSKVKTIMGLVVRQAKNCVLRPTDKRARHDFDIHQTDLNGAKDGDFAIAELLPSRGMKNKRVKIIKILGQENDPSAISLISLAENDLRVEFPQSVIKETEGMTVPDLGKREDLRDMPLVTIDGADSRDFDDAVFAEKTSDGFHLVVAIADVAYYVRPGSALDKEAWTRGNSTYFPDRVLPMLPEALSNVLCSLMPHVERACMAIHMWIDDKGALKDHKVTRGLMRSHARLTYEQVQAAHDGQVDDVTDTLMDDVINPLYDAYKVLLKARQRRGALDLDMPERQILIDDKGIMTGVKPRSRVDSHKLIEEFMVLANVAAATALEAKRAPCMYRVHDTPKSEKLDYSRDFLESFGLTLPPTVSQPKQLNHLLTKAKEHEYSHLISEMILRTQSQAIYSPQNIGHFGLALERYAHFTSPIRRYADLIVHRSLIRAYGLGEGGLSDGEVARIEDTAEHISTTERASANAERSAVDRFTASFLESKVGAQFSGRISGVAKFGLFIRLDETGADGLVPVRTLGSDYFVHDEEEHALIGRKSKKVYRLGAPVTIVVREADMMTGSTIFEIINDKNGADIEGFESKNKRSRVGRKKPPKMSGKDKSFKKEKAGVKKPFKGKKKGAPKKKR